MSDLLLKTLLLSCFGLGFAMATRSLPGRALLQGWLESTWTHGKPLSCWFCLIFWGALLGSFLLPWGNLRENAFVALGAAGLAGPIMNRLNPILPEAGIPELELEDAGDRPN